jgi:hypothetical protein
MTTALTWSSRVGDEEIGDELVNLAETVENSISTVDVDEALIVYKDAIPIVQKINARFSKLFNPDLEGE